MKLPIPAALTFFAAFAVVTSGAVVGGAAEAATNVETLYAELAKLPASEREKRLVAGARKEGTLAYIETISTSIARPHEKLFLKSYPFLKMKMTRIGSKDAAELIVAEEAAGRHLNSLINMFVPDMGRVFDQDIPAVYVTPATDAILPKYRSLLDPNNRWTPWEWSEHGLTYNSQLLPPDKAPKSYWDLCKPHFKGQVSFDTAETRFLYGMYKMMGEDKLKEWLQCISKNKPIIQNGHTTRMTLMLAGDHAASPDQYLYRGTKMYRANPKKNPFKVAYEAPVLAFANAISINKNASQPYTAALYTDWCLSRESQEYMQKKFRGPVTIPHPYMPENVTLVPLDLVNSALAEKLFGYWDTYIGKARGG